MSGCEYAGRVRGFVAGAIIGLAIIASPTASSAQVAITVPPDVLADLTAACDTEGPACVAAIQNLVAALAAANPGVPQATLIGSIAAAVSESFNGGELPTGIASNILASTASVASELGLDEIANSLEVAVASVNAGEPVNLQAIAEGTASPA